MYWSTNEFLILWLHLFFSLYQYADPVSDLLDKWGAFRCRLFRESCVFHRGNYVKDLSRLGRDLNKVIIVDNSPASYIFHPDNAVSVGDQNKGCYRWCYRWCGRWIFLLSFPLRCPWPHGLTTCLTRSCWTSYRSSRGWAKWIASTQSSSNTGPQANATRPPPPSPQLQANRRSTIKEDKMQKAPATPREASSSSYHCFTGDRALPLSASNQPFIRVPQWLWTHGQPWSDMNQLIRVIGWKDECLEDIFLWRSVAMNSQPWTRLGKRISLWSGPGNRFWKKVYLQNTLDESLKRRLCAADSIWLLIFFFFRKIMPLFCQVAHYLSGVRSTWSLNVISDFFDF